jgi:Cu2+-exporting ATPase/Cu+-exporting ATPase
MSNTNKCEHCNEEIIIPSSLILNTKEYLFCCQGCKTVFEILHDKNLQNYYSFREQSEKSSFAPVKTTNTKFEYLDTSEFIDKYSKKTESTYTLSFYLEGIHCLACLWLIEKLPDFIPEVLHSKLNMSKSVVEVTIISGAHFNKVAKQLETLGYPPHPIMESSQIEELKRKEEHLQLIKIAISFFCAGNIMLMTFSVYAGALGQIKQYFEVIGCILAIPVVTYCSTSFYRNAFSSLKNKTLSIDFPIVVAMILGSILSLYSAFTDGAHIYFDSLAMLVFLLLTSRYLLKKMQEKGLSASDVSSFFSTLVATRVKNNLEEEVFAKFLEVGDTIVIKAGETIPADATIAKGTSVTNNSLLTGESLPVKVSKGDIVYSGTVNIDSTLIASIDKIAEESKLGSILKTVEKGWNKKTEIIRLTDTISKYFVATVFLSALCTFLYFLFQGDLEAAITRSLTLIIITCPCALGLTTPLSLTLTLSKLAKLGIIIKDESVIEKVTKSKNIVLDKTGTLTHGKFKVFKRNRLKNIENIDQIIYTLEERSKHPIAESIKNSIIHSYRKRKETLSALPTQNYQEIIGVGPSAEISDNFYEIKSLDNPSQGMTEVGLFCNSELIEEIYLKDTIKPEITETIIDFQRSGLKPFILSGDNTASVTQVANELDLTKKNCLSNQSPQDKESFIKSHPLSIMVGDGANDAIALTQAWVGIAVHGSVDIALRASNVFMAENNLKNISYLITASHETIYLIKRNLIFSLLYNVVGSMLAILGHISPLTAAILMPLSSFTVLISTLVSTKKLREIGR